VGVEVKPSVCRNCGAFCPILVTIEDGVAVKVEGDPDAPIYNGFICPKAKAVPAQHAGPERLLHSLKRLPDGSRVRISNDQVVAEISERLARIIAEHGPQSVAVFLGGGVMEQPIAGNAMASFVQAIGSPMMFTSGTIDQPGLMMADALHGTWQGGRMHPARWETCLFVGANPVVSKQHLLQNPGQQLKALTRAGARLIVIDPRRSETARRAAVHLQTIPGEDPTVLAGLIHLIFALDGVDRGFVAQNAQGAEALREATADFTPSYVAARAGVSPADLTAAARILIEARGGDSALGVGPSMATRGTLTSYLALCIQTLRGFWAREGEPVSRPRVLMPRRIRKAQPSAPRPAWGLGLETGVRGLQLTAAGMPTAALPELMRSKQIRALFLHAGAMHSWPEHGGTAQALGALDLLVTHDVELTATAALADYVIATKRALETPVTSQVSEATGDLHPGYDWNEPYGFYRPAVLEPPPGSDLMEGWQTYYRIAQRLGLKLQFASWSSSEGGAGAAIDMEREPSTDEIYALWAQGSAVPLSQVKQHPHGAVFEEARDVVGARDPDCDARLELADAAMIAQLRQVRGEDAIARRKTSANYPLLLISRRMQETTNSGVKFEGMKRSYNPAFMHPDDMARLSLAGGDMVEIRSRHGAIVGFVEADASLRPGVVAMTHGFGARFGRAYDPRRDGANVNELLSWTDDADPYHGMPRMSAVPISVRATNAELAMAGEAAE
jgi:anaerobic selenocysteine-containing dehydrogenase